MPATATPAPFTDAPPTETLVGADWALLPVVVGIIALVTLAVRGRAV
jgi:hypothetical protein